MHPPVGSASVSGADTPIRRARLAWGVSITDSFGFGGTGDLGAVREDDGRVHAKPAVSASLAGKVAGALGGFVGFVGESAELSSDTRCVVGPGWLGIPPGMRHQLDVWVAGAFRGGPEDYFLSADSSVGSAKALPCGNRTALGDRIESP